MADRRETRGFTLVELMIVVAIIGLLITLLVPVVTKATAIIITAQTKGILKEIALGLEAFRNDFGCYPPSGPDGALNLPDGASRLVYHLRGPAAAGWGTTAGGLMPFPGGRARKTYGPYYEAEESRVVYFDDADKTVAGFTDAFQPVGLRDDVVVGRILYFRCDKREGDTTPRFHWKDNEVPGYVTDPTKQAFMGYTSPEQAGNCYILDKAYQCPKPEHTDLFDEPGECPIVENGTICGETLRIAPVPATKQYLLVSPGPDRCYGLVYESDDGIVPDTDGTEGGTCDDLWYAR